MSETSPAPASRPVPGVPEGYDAVGESRRLLRTIRAGALATVDAQGRPFATLVNVATASDGSPILLLSRLSRHTRLLEADGRCSLLLSQGGKGDPLAHPRLTVTGLAARDHSPHLRARFLARHPKSALYADFADFSFWRLAPEEFHLNGGFARAADFSASEILTPSDAELAAAEAGLLDWLNADRRSDLARLAACAGEDGKGWRVTGLDALGLDLLAGDRTARLDFETGLSGMADLRAALDAVLAKGRETE